MVFSGDSSASSNNSILHLRERSIAKETEDFLHKNAGVVLKDPADAIKIAHYLTFIKVRHFLITPIHWSRQVPFSCSSNSSKHTGSKTLILNMWTRNVSDLSWSASLAIEPERMASSFSFHRCYYSLPPLDLQSDNPQLYSRTYFSKPATELWHWNDITSDILSWSNKFFVQYMELCHLGHVHISSENEETMPTISRNVSTEVMKKPEKTYTCTFYIQKHKYSFWSILFSSLVEHKSQPSSCEHYHIPYHILYTICIVFISYLLYTVSLFMVIANLSVSCEHREILHTKGKPLEKIFMLRFLSQLFFIKWNFSSNGNSSANTKGKHSHNQLSADSCLVDKEAKTRLLDEKALKYDFLKAFFDWPSARYRTDDKNRREVGSALDCERKEVHDCQYLGSSNCVFCHKIVTRNRKGYTSESKQDADRLHQQQCCQGFHNFSSFEPEEAKSFYNKVQPALGTIFVSPAYRFLPDPTSDPAIDLVHVGYRLATLSALPPSVSVSRLRLADAGFFFKGREDELTCYSCGKSYSGWKRGDSPLEIHRRMSPECRHVLGMASDMGYRGPEESGVPGHDRAYPSASDRGQAEASPRVQQNTVDEGRRSQPVSDIQNPYQFQVPLEDGEHTPHQNEARPLVPHVQETITSTATTFPGASSSFSSSSFAPAGPGRQAALLASPSRSDGIVTSAPQSSLTSSPVAPSFNQNSNTPSRVPTGSNDATPLMTPPSAQTQGTVASGRRSTTPASAASAASRSEDSPNHNSSRAAEADSRSLFPRAGLDLGGAVYPMYQDMQSRRRTFTSWDDRKAPPLDMIILSGMFYAGYADCVRCFYCGVGLKHWLVTDDVMTEHVRWRPGCQYLRAIKGDDYIRETLIRLDQPNPATSQTEGDNTPTTATTLPSSTATPATTSATASTSTFTFTSTAAVSASSSPSPQFCTSTSTSASATAWTTARVSASTSSNSSLPGRSISSTASTTTPQATGNTSTHSVAEDTTNSTTVVTNAAEEAETVVQLQEENRALESSFRCRVCQEAEIDTILMPCGHLVTCETCTRSVTSCPLCHETIRATARVHLS